MSRWRLSGTLLEFCNCEPSCGCNFRGFPNSPDGSCRGFGLYAVEEGRYGDLDLGGARVAWALLWPGPIHEGDGRGRAFVDCRDEQFEALRRIWRGEEGYASFEIFNSTLVEPTAVERRSVQVTLDGKRSRVVVEGRIDAAMTPLLDPVSGEENDVRVVKPSGFDYQDGAVAQGERMRLTLPEQAFEFSGGHAAVARFAYAGG
jgi:hypothetical protein